MREDMSFFSVWSTWSTCVYIIFQRVYKRTLMFLSGRTSGRATLNAVDGVRRAAVVGKRPLHERFCAKKRRPHVRRARRGGRQWWRWRGIHVLGLRAIVQL